MSNLHWSQIQQGKTYRAKEPRLVNGKYDDRTVVFVSAVMVQLTKPLEGKRLPVVLMRDFLAWASHEVQ